MKIVLIIVGALTAISTMAVEPIVTCSKAKFWLQTKDIGPICNAWVIKEINKLGDGNTEYFADAKNTQAWDMIHREFDGLVQSIISLEIFDAEDLAKIDQEILCKKLANPK